MTEDSGNPHKMDEKFPQVLVGIAMVRDGRLRFRYPESASRLQLDYVAAAYEDNA